MKASGTKNTGAKNTGKSAAPEKKSWGVIFWVIFFVVITGLFIFQRDKIRETISSGLNPEQNTQEKPPVIDLVSRDQIQNENTSRPGNNSANNENNPADRGADNSTGRQTGEEAAGTGTADSHTPAVQPAGATEQEPVRPPVFRDRAVYFISIDRDGGILRNKVNRSLPLTDSPLVDTMTALLAGPDSDEARRGFITLIPDGTRIINATVRGSTAYINLSEDFQFNTRGVEGYEGAVRQIVWTATEFPTVSDVQILIEGRRIDYLGESIWIGSPVSRNFQ